MARAGPSSSQAVADLGNFLELLGKRILSVTVALLTKRESEASGGHLVTTTWDKCLESALPEAKHLLTCWFPEPVTSVPPPLPTEPV